MDNTQETTVETTPQANTGVGGKVAIVIILIVLVVGAFYYFFMMKKPAAPEVSNNTPETVESLSSELDASTNVDLDADLKAIEESFN